MEQRVINYSQQQVIHKAKVTNKKNIKSDNTERILFLKKPYIISRKTLQMYRIVGDIVGATLIVAMCYLIYCCMWILV